METPDNSIRSDQARFAQRQEGSTISVPGANRTNRYVDSSKPRKPFVPKGHDRILSDLQASKQLVEVITLSGMAVVGTIEARDKFTITIEVKAERQADTGEAVGTTEGLRVTFYKHAIESFGPVIGEQGRGAE